MRDFERLEELSSTVHSGLEANGVIWAIDQALAGSELDSGARDSLESGRNILRALSDPNSQWPPATLRRSQNMLGGEATHSVRSMILIAVEPDDKGSDGNEVLANLADALDAICKGESAESYAAELELALKVFSMISEVRLGQASGIVRARRERMPWPLQTTISLSP